MGTCDNVDADQIAFDGFDGLGACVGSCFDGSDITHDHSGDERVTHLRHGTGQFDVGGFQHGIGPLDEGDQAAGFNKSDSLWHI